MKLEGACERLGRNACEKLGNAIAETATAITESHMENQAATVAKLTASPTDIHSIMESHMANLTTNPADIRSITENQMTITANPSLAMVIHRFFPG